MPEFRGLDDFCAQLKCAEGNRRQTLSLLEDHFDDVGAACGAFDRSYKEKVIAIFDFVSRAGLATAADAMKERVPNFLKGELEMRTFKGLDDFRTRLGRAEGDERLTRSLLDCHFDAVSAACGASKDGSYKQKFRTLFDFVSRAGLKTAEQIMKREPIGQKIQSGP
jgi:hypothetical protein